MPTTTIRRTRKVVAINHTDKATSQKNEQSQGSSSLIQSLFILVVLVALACGYQAGPSLLVAQWRQRSECIHVWDNVLSQNFMEELRQALIVRAEERGNEKHEQTVIFPWPTPATELARRHRIEQILSDIMTQLHPQEAADTSKPAFWVEFWDRQHWMSVEAHADQDEGTFNKALQSGIPEPKVRHPLFGHVLYLEQGSESLLEAPTLVFANASTGGDMILKKFNSLDQVDMEDPWILDNVELLAVPNLPGRLIRFNGNLLHSVPRPANLYLMPSDPRRAKDRRSEPELFGRSVLLFNLWPGSHPPAITQTQPIYGINETLPNHHKTQLGNLSCSPRSEWKSISVSSEYEGSWRERFVSALLPWWTTKYFQVPLMGVKVQRGMEDEIAILKASTSVELGLTSGKTDPSPKRMYLEQASSITWKRVTNFIKTMAKGGATEL